MGMFDRVLLDRCLKTLTHEMGIIALSNITTVRPVVTSQQP